MTKSSEVEILTERLRLTLPDASHASQLLRYFEDNRNHLAPWSPPCAADFYSEAYWEKRLELTRERFETDRGLALVVACKESGRIVGTCNFNEFIRGPFQACLLGYGLDHRELGKGLMSEALRAGLDYVFGELGLHRVMANYVPTNEASGRVLRRLGFVVEGFARDYLFIDGAWRDHVLTSLHNPNPTAPTF